MYRPAPLRTRRPWPTWAFIATAAVLVVAAEYLPDLLAGWLF